jgi:hypothetical protein
MESDTVDDSLLQNVRDRRERARQIPVNERTIASFHGFARAPPSANAPREYVWPARAELDNIGTVPARCRPQINNRDRSWPRPDFRRGQLRTILVTLQSQTLRGWHSFLDARFNG